MNDYLLLVLMEIAVLSFIYMIFSEKYFGGLLDKMNRQVCARFL